MNKKSYNKFQFLFSPNLCDFNMPNIEGDHRTIVTNGFKVNISIFIDGSHFISVKNHNDVCVFSESFTSTDDINLSTRPKVASHTNTEIKFHSNKNNSINSFLLKAFQNELLVSAQSIHKLDDVYDNDETTFVDFDCVFVESSIESITIHSIHCFSLEKVVKISSTEVFI